MNGGLILSSLNKEFPHLPIESGEIVLKIPLSMLDTKTLYYLDNIYALDGNKVNETLATLLFCMAYGISQLPSVRPNSKTFNINSVIGSINTIDSKVSKDIEQIDKQTNNMSNDKEDNVILNKELTHHINELVSSCNILLANQEYLKDKFNYLFQLIENEQSNSAINSLPFLIKEITDEVTKQLSKNHTNTANTEKSQDIQIQSISSVIPDKPVVPKDIYNSLSENDMVNSASTIEKDLDSSPSSTSVTTNNEAINSLTEKDMNNAINLLALMESE